jgi:hypothetical protein
MVSMICSLERIGWDWAMEQREIAGLIRFWE